MPTLPADREPVHLRLLTAGGNWMRVGSLLALAMSGYRSPLPRGSTVAVVSAEPGASCTDAPHLVADGTYDLAITTPISYGRMAHEGTGLFDRPLPLRALAALPHDDRLVIAVREETGITSIEQLLTDRTPLRISMPDPATRHPASVVAEEVLRAYGASLDDLRAWGSVLLDDRPVDIAGDPNPVDPSFEMIIDEAIMTPRWRRIFERYAMRVLPIAPNVLGVLERQGFRRGVIAPGRLPGLTTAVETLDFSGWLLFCREDLDDGIVTVALDALIAQRDAIEQSIGPDRGLSGPVDPGSLWRDTGLPLHPAAERFYRERGHMPLGTGRT